uniref:Shelterin complex subunit TPP1/Est3 domain-containing protein n=1 Tax=Myripristis murdjan TaxID=586833 RepID=A0A668AG97_9TELE
MVQTNRNKLEPWIEKMILSHGSEQISSTVWLKAHVIGVGQMSQSQAQGSDGPTGLLFLSDGKVQIPAVLTKSAWEHLQEQEDRECFSSLVNTTVCLQAYRMQFHMALEETRCRFFLSIDKLATAATGPEKDNTPCCTTLPSVRYKICKTWESLLSHDLLDSQKSQCEFDLSDLLGEWQHNCVQDVLQDIRERLRPEWRSSPQPSTSSWEEHFSVPVTWLLIPDEEAQEPQKPFSEGSKTPGRLFVDSEDKKTGSSLACKHTETVDPCVDDFESRTARPAAFKEIPHIMPLKSLPDSTATKKRNEPMQDALTVLEEEGTEEEDARVAQSPPSWLFETQALSKAHAPGSSSQGKAARTVLRKIPTVHSDGTQFSYSYQVSGQSLQDMSKFEVTDGLLHWAQTTCYLECTDVRQCFPHAIFLFAMSCLKH